MNPSTPQYNSVPFPAPTYVQSTPTAFPQPPASTMPAYMYPSPQATNQYYTRPRAYSTSYGAYPQQAQPIVYTTSHHSHGSHGRSHSHSHNHGRRSHSHSRHHSHGGHHDSGRRHHHSSSHHGHGHHSSSPGYTYGNYGSNGAYYGTTGHQYPQVARVESRHSHNVLYNPHNSHHSRRYSEPGFSFGDRIRNFFSFGSSSRSPRGGQYLDARTGRKVDHRGREIYRV